MYIDQGKSGSDRENKMGQKTWDERRYPIMERKYINTKVQYKVAKMGI